MNNLVKALILSVFFISGAAGLMYEVVWVRWFSFVFGNTVHAVSVVMAAFMAGLGLGSYVIGRYADRIKSPLRLYAVLELLIAVSAVGIAVSRDAAYPLYRMIYLDAADSLVLLTSVRFIISFLLLLIPTTLMGGTLPVLCDFFIKRLPNLSRWVGFLYFFNTVGAVVGVMAAGFLLIPRVGMLGTVTIAIGGNLLACVIALLFRHTSITSIEEEPAAEISDESRSSGISLTLIGLCFATSGFCALALEVIWTRVLIVVFGSTTYSFTVMLGIFLFGIAAGGGIFGLLTARIKERKNIFLLLLCIELALGLLLLIDMASVNFFPYLFLLLVKKFSFSWPVLILSKVLISGLVLFPLALLFGGTFPVISALFVRNIGTLGRSVGTLYGLNSLGSILGSLLAGFLIVPVLGTENGLKLVSGLLLFSAFLVITAWRLDERRRFGVLPIVVLLGAVIVPILAPGYDRDIVSVGVYFRPDTFIKEDGTIDIASEMKDRKLVFYKEGISSTATIRNYFGRLEYFIDGKVEASTQMDDMRLQRMMGYFPLLFSREPKSAVNIGLGAGITLGALSTYPLEKLAVIEIEPEIRNVARQFGEYNNHVVDHPLLSIIIADGRNHLLLTEERYDVITSDPFEPLVGGAANLYTFEHFKNGAKRLNPGGCMCQYLPLYQLFPRDFQSVIKTFHEVFPYVLAWYTGVDAVLLGYLEEPVIDFDRIRQRMAIPAVNAGLREVGFDTIESILGTFIMYLKPGDSPFNPDVPINTDNFPTLEFNAPQAHVVFTVPDNIDYLAQRATPFPLQLLAPDQDEQQIGEWLASGYRLRELLLNGKKAVTFRRFDVGEEIIRECLRILPDNQFFRTELSLILQHFASALIQAGNYRPAYDKLMEFHALGGNNPFSMADIAYGSMLFADVEQAMFFIDMAIQQLPDEAHFHEIKGEIFLKNGQFEEAQEALNEAQRLGGDQFKIGFLRAQLFRASDRIDEAIIEYQRMLEIQQHPEALFLLAELQLLKGEHEQGLQNLLKAESLNPANVPVKIYLARLYLLLQDTEKAKQKLVEASALDQKAVDQILLQDPILNQLRAENSPASAP